MRELPSKVRGCLLVSALMALLGCSELGARRHAREGNRLFKQGDYAAAIREYEEAERRYPGIPAVALNKGLACQKLVVPGARSEESTHAVDCALAAFRHLTELRPNDPRGDDLYVQTLFDGDRFEALSSMYQEKLRSRPEDLGAINGLIQVYSRWNRPEDALRWVERRADIESGDAEAQYAVGVFIYDLLAKKGGGTDKSTFDPRPREDVKEPPPTPLFRPGDILGPERVKLAESGISYLDKALSLRPKYRDAMTFKNLLYRQRSFAFFDAPGEWQASVDAAESWRHKAIELDAAPKAQGQ